MSNEDINKAIAEFCGWNQKSSHFGGATGIWTDSSGVDHTRFPDYCKDLNAMHEAEKVLTQIQWSKYRIDLTSICERDDVARLGYTPTHQSFWHATARQRAEAFLRTTGKWEEGKWEEIGEVETFGKVERIGKFEESK